MLTAEVVLRFTSRFVKAEVWMMNKRMALAKTEDMVTILDGLSGERALGCKNTKRVVKRS